jgi:hypothetical protein
MRPFARVVALPDPKKMVVVPAESILSDGWVAG